MNNLNAELFNKSVKQSFIDYVLYSNSKITADDEQYQLVQEFIELNGNEFFDEAETIDDIIDSWEVFLENK